MKRRIQRLKNLVFVFFLFFFIWVLLQFLAPFALPRGSVSNLSGIVGFSDNQNIIQNMSFPWNLIYSSGDRLCHQKADRTLFLNENEMPFCSRCTAIWFGLAIGLGFMVLYTIELNEKFLIALIAALFPISIDGIGQLIGFWESTNLIRIFTGLPVGIICGIAIGIILDELRTMRIFRSLNNFSFFLFLKKH
jgi:uncharacterized membrane protein